MDLNNKAALITGGARMGAAVAEALARRGCAVAVTYRTSRRSAEETVRRAQALGAPALAVRADVRAERDLARAVAAVDRRFRRLDVLVNMASAYEKAGVAKLSRGPLRPWEASMGIDLRAAYLLSLKAAPLMRRGGGGRIVNFSDWLPASGRPRYGDYLTYYVAKGAVKSLTEALALALAPTILVNAVAPGPILPPAGLSRPERLAVVKATPARRWGGPEEVAKAVLFLIDTDFVTGETVRVDGGRHLF
jgi:NAD(P)-dependent dehydrogenase (short-subunit alcohol dehydrogenase family)